MKKTHSTKQKFFCPCCHQRTAFVVPVLTDPTEHAGLRVIVSSHEHAMHLNLNIDPNGDAECVNCGGEMPGDELSSTKMHQVALAS